MTSNHTATDDTTMLVGQILDVMRSAAPGLPDDDRIPTQSVAAYAGLPPWRIPLRSTRTHREIINALPEPTRSRRLEEAAVFGVPLDGYDDEAVLEIAVPYDTTWLQRFGGSMRRWVAEHVVPQIPDGYVVRPLPTAAALVAWRDLAARREDAAAAAETLSAAVRDALAAGVPATRLAADLGVSRARIYQLRDGER